LQQQRELSAPLTNALGEWREILGARAVTCEADTLQQAEIATFRTTARVAAILRPTTHEDVQRSVIVANRFGIPLYPISTGKNWGYGSRVPVQDAVLLDLASLNRITDFSEDLGYVTVEPGVTQRQLYEFLQGRRSAFWMDATGSSPECSVIGNTLDRGFGHTPMGDHCSQACGFRVVLPTGLSIETGFGRFPGTVAGALSRWGVGPALDGLFSQSSLGIVTRMTVWLMPAPEHFEAFVFQANKPVAPIVDALRPLRMSGVLRSVMHIGNDYKVISGSGQYPWQATAGKTPLLPDVMATLRRDLRIAQWSGSGALYGTYAQVKQAKSALRRALRGNVDRLQFFSRRKIDVIRRLERPYRRLTGRTDLGRALQLIPPLLSVLQGQPTPGFLASAYWRKKAAPPKVADPDRDKCGLLWCSPVAPNTGKDVALVTELATDIALKYGFEPIISVSLFTERMTISTIALTYDREVAGEDERAMQCYRTLTERLLERGYPPYRLNVASMEYVAGTGDYGTVMQALKSALDPNGILARGRYQPRSSSVDSAIDGGDFSRKPM
jgi:4-cresol dehydrogenase (hydroxylating)